VGRGSAPLPTFGRTAGPEGTGPFSDEETHAVTTTAEDQLPRPTRRASGESLSKCPVLP